jgi:hypothetical protein
LKFANKTLTINTIPKPNNKIPTILFIKNITLADNKRFILFAKKHLTISVETKVNRVMTKNRKIFSGVCKLDFLVTETVIQKNQTKGFIKFRKKPFVMNVNALLKRLSILTS